MLKRPWSRAVALTLAPVALAMPAVAVQGDPEEELQAIIDEYKDAEVVFRQKYQAASEDERPQIIEEFYPNPEDFAPMFIGLAREYPKTQWAATAYGWVVQNVRGKHREAAVQSLIADHLEDEAMATVCQSLQRDPSDEAIETVRTVLEKSPHPTVQGHACFALGMQLKARSETEQDAMEKDIQLGEFEELMNRVVKEFPKLELYEGFGEGTLAKSAEGALFEHKHLQIGMVAPDIEGEDLDGNSFKLSDYRGKVVLLDFWGHW